jgi:hypothetical protein
MILAAVIVGVIALVSIIIYFKQNIRVTPVDKGSVINKICYSLPRQDGRSYSNFSVDIYLNEAGQIGGYRTYNNLTDGGTSSYFNQEGAYIGKWGVVPAELRQETSGDTYSNEQNDFKLMRQEFTIKKTVRCDV